MPSEVVKCWNRVGQTGVKGLREIGGSVERSDMWRQGAVKLK